MDWSEHNEPKWKDYIKVDWMDRSGKTGLKWIERTECAELDLIGLT